MIIRTMPICSQTLRKFVKLLCVGAGLLLGWPKNGVWKCTNEWWVTDCVPAAFCFARVVLIRPVILLLALWASSAGAQDVIVTDRRPVGRGAGRTGSYPELRIQPCFQRKHAAFPSFAASDAKELCPAADPPC